MITIRGGPPMSNTRTSLPQIQSKFDLEPNPFEQSFKDNPSEAIHSTQPNTTPPSSDHHFNDPRPRRARSSSLHYFSPHMHPTPPAIRHSPDSNLAKVSLPGINFITSPAILVHHPAPNSSKSLSPPSLTASQSLHSSRPSSMLVYPWNFGGLGGSLRSGPLSPALLNGPAPLRTTQPVAHTGLSPLLDSGGAITPGTQALIALLSGNEENNDINAAVVGRGPSLPSATMGSSSNPIDIGSTDLSMNLTHPADQRLRSSINTNTPISNPESLSAASHRSTGPTFTSIGSLPIDSPSKPSTSSSAFGDLVNPSVSLNCSPPSPSRTLDLIKTNIISSHSRLASVSSTPTNAPSSSSTPKSLHVKPEFPLNPCVQTSISTPLGPPVAKTLHPVPSLGSSQSTHATMGSFPPSATATTRSSFPSSTIPLPIQPPPPMQSVNEITASLPPTQASRSMITPLPHNSGDCIDDQYNTNPLYLLTVAHEASSRMSQLSHHSEALDDATATAAAALTGLGSSGGSRYSSPGPSIIPSGTLNSQHPVINNMMSTQPILMNHEGSGTSVTSPRLSSLRPNVLAEATSINPRAILCTDSEGGLITPHQAPPFTIERRDQLTNDLLSEGTSIASGSTTQLSLPSSHPTHSLSVIGSTNMSDANGRQSFSSLDSSAAKKKGKKRKEVGDVESENAQQNDAGNPQHLRSKSEVESSPGLVASTVSRGVPKGTRLVTSAPKTKKHKKSKTEDSGDDSDSRDGCWGPEDDASFMQQHGADEADSGRYPTLSLTDSNYYSTNPSAPNQPSSSGRPETEEEKRKNFLERNRQAALKCRQRKKAWLANLQTKIEFLSTENESLQLTIGRLREEIDSFRNILISHKDCPINIAGGRGATTTIGDLMGRDPGFVTANTAAVLTQQHHDNGGRLSLRHASGPHSLHAPAHIAATLTSTNGSIRRSHHDSHGAVASSFGY